MKTPNSYAWIIKLSQVNENRFFIIGIHSTPG